MAAMGQLIGLGPVVADAYNTARVLQQDCERQSEQGQLGQDSNKSMRVARSRWTDKPNGPYFVICGMWLFILLSTCPPLFGFGVRYGLEPINTHCTIDYWHPENNPLFGFYTTYLSSFFYIIPFLLMCVGILKAGKTVNQTASVQHW